MPNTTPSKRRKTTRLLTSSVSKTSLTVFNALGPLFSLRLAWNALLRDPASALVLPLLPSLFISQTAFVVLLLPLHTASVRPPKKRGIVKMDTLGEAIQAKAAPLIQSLFFLLPATLLLYGIIIVFGAPLTTHTSETLLTAVHLALLCTYPLSSSITPTLENIRQLITLEYKADADVLKWTYWGAVGTLLGAWLGAVPIPLDWDREWQVLHPLFQAYPKKWPITIVVGAYFGHALSLLIGLAWHGVSTKGPKSVVQLESIEEEKKDL